MSLNDRKSFKFTDNQIKNGPDWKPSLITSIFTLSVNKRNANIYEPTNTYLSNANKVFFFSIYDINFTTHTNLNCGSMWAVRRCETDVNAIPDKNPY